MKGNLRPLAVIPAVFALALAGCRKDAAQEAPEDSGPVWLAVSAEIIKPIETRAAPSITSPT